MRERKEKGKNGKVGKKINQWIETNETKRKITHTQKDSMRTGKRTRRKEKEDD